jgi:hypothetical protein
MGAALLGVALLPSLDGERELLPAGACSPRPVIRDLIEKNRRWSRKWSRNPLRSTPFDSFLPSSFRVRGAVEGRGGFLHCLVHQS